MTLLDILEDGADEFLPRCYWQHLFSGLVFEDGVCVFGEDIQSGDEFVLFFKGKNLIAFSRHRRWQKMVNALKFDDFMGSTNNLSRLAGEKIS